MSVISGGTQTAQVATELPQAIVVRVTDAKSLVLPQQLVNFVVVKGGGTVFAGSALTNTAGEARERWTLGNQAGEQVLEARAVDQMTGQGIVFSQITATALPGPVATLTVSEARHDMFLRDTLDIAPLVTAADSFGNSVESPTLTLLAPDPLNVLGSKVTSAREAIDDVTVSSGSVQSRMIVAVLHDLRVMAGGQLEWACSGGRMRIDFGDIGDTVATGLRTELKVDSIAYSGAGLGYVYWKGPFFYTLVDGAIKTLDQETGSLGFVQTPGRLRWFQGASGSADLTIDNEVQLVYNGGSFCGSWGRRSEITPVVLEKDF